jgi:hypothetical protein
VRRTLALDEQAVRATGDLDAAIRYIERSEKGGELADKEERIRHLREVFG